MRDQIDGRLWAELGPIFSEQMSGLIKATMLAFCRLVAIQFAAPWRRGTAGNCQAGR